MADINTDKLQNILNNPEIIGMLSQLLNSGNSSSADDEGESDIASEAKILMNKINSGNDKRINLLNALRPYMRDSRASSIDRAVKMIKLTQLGSILKDL